jgi:hypothetical protein
MQREQDVSVDVKYTSGKSETDLESELLKAMCRWQKQTQESRKSHICKKKMQ